MAFDIRYWSRVSAGINTTTIGLNLNGHGNETASGPAIYAYRSLHDTIQDIVGIDEDANYFSEVGSSLKFGDIIQLICRANTFVPVAVTLMVSDVQYDPPTEFGPSIVRVSIQNSANYFTVSNISGRGAPGNLASFVNPQLITDSGVAVATVAATTTVVERLKRLGLSPSLALDSLQLQNIGSISFGPSGVGSLFVGGLQAMQFIDNDFGSDTQICTLITGELPGSSTTPSALLELKSTTGVFLPSRLTSTQIDALTAPADGSQCYNKTLQRMVFKENGVWVAPTLADGTVKSLSPGTGIGMSPNPITTTGTISNLGVLTVGSSSNIASSGGQNPTLDLIPTGVSAGTYTYIASLETDANGRIHSIASGTAPVSGVLSVSGTAGRVTSSGGANPVIDLAATTGLAGIYAYPSSITVDNYRRVTDIVEGSPPTPGNLSAKYILQAVDGTLPNAQSLGTLSSGILFNTVDAGRGVLRMAVEGSDYPSVTSVLSAQTTANSALTLATLAMSTATTADATAAAASAQAAAATSTANLALAGVGGLVLASYITKTPVGILPNSQNLRDLGTGVLKTVVHGVPPDHWGQLELATAGNDFAGPGAKYILQEANAGATQGQSLGALTTGLLLNTVSGTTGTLSAAVPGTDYATPASVAAVAATVAGISAAKFITQTPSSFLSANQSLSLLATGLLKNTTGTGVLSTAVAGTDYATPGSISSTLGAVKFIIQTADANAPNAQVLGALSTGLLKNTTTTGVLSSAIAGTDYYAPNFPTVITDTVGSGDSGNLSIGLGSTTFAGPGFFYNTAFGKKTFTLGTVVTHGSAFGNNAGASQVAYAGCSFFGDQADASVNNLSNANAFGYLAKVGVSNAFVLGKNCNIGIGQASPIYGLDIGTDTNVSPQIRLQSSAIPSEPPNANEGIFSVNLGAPRFVSASGTTTYSGLLIALTLGGANATTGTATMNGTTPVVISTTAIKATSHVVVNRDNGAGAPSSGVTASIGVGNKIAGTSFSIVSSSPGDNTTIRWSILNSS